MYSTLSITDFGQGGYGISKLPNGKTALVLGSIPGETVCAQIIEEKNTYAICKTLDIISPSKDRIAPICRNYNKCGGCSLMHMTYSTQLKLKNELFVKNIYSISSNVDILPPIYSSDYNYRSRVRFNYLAKNKKIQLSFLENKSSVLVPINFCHICDFKLNDFIKSPPLLNPWELDKAQLSCISTDNEVLYEKNKIGYISITTENMGSRKLYVSNQVFFQSNLLLLPKLVDLIGGFITGEKVLDLYSGVGTFSSFLEDKYSVTSVEINKLCLKLANMNLKKTEFITSSVEHLNPLNFKADTVIVDPPRTGLEKNVPGFISLLTPKTIIYVSCFMPTLMRDLNIFKSFGYLPKTAVMLDFYPQTPHLECVVMMSRDK